MSANEVVVPDIGDFADIPVIEILVSAGESVTAEQPLVTLESDKATMDVPAPFDGVVKQITVSVGDRVSEGAVIAHIDGVAGDGAASDDADGGGLVFEGAGDEPATSAGGNEESASGSSGSSGGDEVSVEVPDIGDFTDIPVIELLVSPGDMVSVEQPLVTLESDKATMDVPAPVSGELVSLSVAVGDKVSMGTAVAVIRGAAGAAPAAAPAPRQEAAPAPAANKPQTAAPRAPSHPGASAPDPRAPVGRASPTAALTTDASPGTRFHATPAIRRFARELGVDLGGVKGTGRKGRILKEDVVGHVKGVMSGQSVAPSGATPAGGGIPPIPLPDFSKFGKVETLELGRIKRLSGPHLQRAWLNIPHVTHHDDADITEMEAFRKSLKDEAAKRDLRITPLVFLMKALVAGMQKFPTVNSSLAADGGSLIIKHYYNVGIAVDTPNGLVVPVIREVDSKGIMELSQDLADMSAKARDGKLSPADMSGGSMSISSLGGIGGTAFTPIVNAPEVAILGVARSAMKPVWNGKEFIPRLMLPLSLSYDHRVIDGAEGARFTSYIGQLLGDVRRLLL